MAMKPAAWNEAGILAFSLLNKLLDSLVAKGVLSEADVLAFINSAADDFRQDTRANARLAEDFLRDVAKAHPASKKV